MKRQLPFFLVFVFGAFMAIQYFVPHKTSEAIYEFFIDILPIIGVFALALGIWSLTKVSVDKIRYRRENWQYAIFTLLGLFLMILFGFTDENWGFHWRMSPEVAGEGTDNPNFRLLFNYVMIPIQATMFALLAFFIASASYRAFRARNLLATLLLIAALILMLRFTPFFGDWIGLRLSETATWLMNVPNTAAQRAIVMGVGLGLVATALKVVLGIERDYMGRG